MAYRDPTTGQFISRALYLRIIATDPVMQDAQMNYISSGALVDTGSIMRQVSASAEKQISAALKRYARRFKAESISDRPTQRIHRDVAEGARQAVISAYKSSGIGNTPSYRQNDRGKLKRYSNGAMERAFDDKGFVKYDAKGISFANKTVLDNHAKQWYRLNFGARPKGSKNPNTPAMKFPQSLGGGEVQPNAALVGFKPSKPFRVPQRGIGLWSSTKLASTPGHKVTASPRGPYLYVGTSMIVQRAKRQGNRSPYFESKMAGGIQGKRFLDAGSAYINKEYPKRIANLILDWEKKARTAL